MLNNDSRILAETLSALNSNDTASGIQILFGAYGNRLEKLISVRLDPRIASRVDAADVLQEAFLEITNKISSYNAQTPLYLWLRTIVL